MMRMAIVLSRATRLSFTLRIRLPPISLTTVTGLEKHELAMVGDRLYTDIATGLNFGILSILVLTGEAGEADIAATGIRPDLVFERLSAMNPYL